MKALIINRPRSERTNFDFERFSKLIEVLVSGGINGKYVVLETKAQLLNSLQAERPDIVFCANCYITGDANERLSIHSILAEQQIPYIGSDSNALALMLSKSDLKARWRADGIATPSFFLIEKQDSTISGLDDLDQAADYPYILKPDREGNSRGLDESSIVFDRTALESKLDKLLKTYKRIMAEEYLGIYPDIREFTIAMIGNGEQRLLFPAEISLKQKKKLRVITTHDKDNHLTQATPVPDKALNENLIDFSRKVFEAIAVHDYARCDVIYAGGQLYAIEINGQPMIPDKWFELCAFGGGLNAHQYLLAIFLAGIVRNNQQEVSQLIIPQKMKRNLPENIFKHLTQIDIEKNHVH